MKPLARAAPSATDNPGASVHRDAVVVMAEVPMNGWRKVCALEAIPPLGARVMNSALGNIAVFRNAEDEVFALADKCPHKGGPLSQGIVHGRKVTCPLHNWNIQLEDGHAVAPDVGCAQRFETKVENGVVWLEIQSPASNQS
jgi:nitrite reductase (NADH) small subunit